MRPPLLAAALACTLATLGAVAACGDDKPSTAATGSGSAEAPATPLPPIGVDAIRRFNYVYGDGAKDYDKAVAAARPSKSKPTDWAAVKASCEAALARDTDHGGARYLLGVAQVQLGEGAVAARQLELALAQDWLGFGPDLAKDSRLGAWLATADGKRLAARSAELEAATLALAARGTLVLGRRSPYKAPTATGSILTRGEVYALDLESKRYVRISHSGHGAVAQLRSPDGKELVVVGLERVELPGKTAPPDAAPLLAKSWVQAYDTATWRPVGTKIVVGKARAIGVGHGAGGQLQIATYPAKGRWELGEPVVSSADRGTGRLTKVAGGGPGLRVMVTLEDAWLAHGAPGVDAAWAGEPQAAAELRLVDRPNARFAVPESGLALRTQAVASPGHGRLAFATLVDPCVKDGPAPSLYVGDGATGDRAHLITAKSRFGVRWLDDDRLLYEDGAGGLRLWDAAGRRELGKVGAQAGLALDALAGLAMPPCHAVAPPPPPETVPVIPGDEVPPVDDEGSETDVDPAGVPD